MVDGTEQALAFVKSTFTPTHVSHKQVEARPIGASAFSDDGSGRITLQGGGVVDVPAGFASRATPAEGDMLVRYAPDEAHPDGYLSFSPRAAFDDGYSAIRPAEHHKSFEGGGRGLTFGQAIEQLKAGDRVARDGWNGKGMWLSLVTTWSGNIGPAPEQYALLPFICMRTAQADFVPWLASQTDMLAEDWCVV